MDASPEHGVLVVAGRAATSIEIRSMVGVSMRMRDFDHLLAELEERGVFSRTEAGSIFSRRMLRDDARRVRNAANGSKGGNPALVRATPGAIPEPSRSHPGAIPEPSRSHVFDVDPANINDLPRKSVKAESEAESDTDKNPPSEGCPGFAADARAVWNRVCAQSPACRAFSSARQRKLRARLRDELAGVGWEAYCEKIAATPFLCGDNDRGWRADVDWVLEPQHAARILEGRYDGLGRRKVAARNASLSLLVDYMQRTENDVEPEETGADHPRLGFGSQGVVPAVRQ